MIFIFFLLLLAKINQSLQTSNLKGPWFKCTNQLLKKVHSSMCVLCMCYVFVFMHSFTKINHTLCKYTKTLFRRQKSSNFKRISEGYLANGCVLWYTKDFATLMVLFWLGNTWFYPETPPEGSCRGGQSSWDHF